MTPRIKPASHVCIIGSIIAWCLFVGCNRATPQMPTAELAKALAADDLDAIRAAVAAGRETLGHQAGEPEVPDVFRRVPADARLYSREEAQRGFLPWPANFEKVRWWKKGVVPATLTAPLRVPASVILGSAAAARATLDGAEAGLATAKDAGDFLMWAQEQAGAGFYPFPAARGPSDKQAMKVANRFLARAEREGTLQSVVRNGWIFDDAGDGGLQFDNGECGAAMLDLYGVTKDDRYLVSARKAADWAATRPLCTNWNYNSFSVFLLAKMYGVTAEAKYLDAAVHKARLGVIPGQLVDGPHVGRWLDPHNARPAYHYIMMRALAQLAAVIPPDHADRPGIVRSLALGLTTRNAEMVTRGVMTKDHAMEALLLVNHAFRNDRQFLRDTHSAEAINALGRLVSAEARRGGQPLGPGAWGLFLEFVLRGPDTDLRR